SNTTIAIVDSGIDLTHPDLASRLVGGYNAVSKLTQAQGGDVSDVANSSHGTAVAGVAGAIGNNSIGVAGIGWNLKIMPVRATNEPSGSAVLSVVLAGCRWAADNGAKVVNASFAGVSSSSVQSTGAYLRDRNSILVWSSGNTGSNLGAGVDWPDVLIVGATDPADARPSWGNYGVALDIAAPGTSILTTIKAGQYGTHEGTSFSSPLVAGVLAMAWSVDPTLSRTKVIDAVLSSAVDIGAPGEDEQFGRGRVDVKEAVLGAWRYAHVYPVPLTSIDQLGSLDGQLWPVRPPRQVKSVYFGDGLHAPAIETRNGDVLESSAINTTSMVIDRAQLRISTFQTGSAELVTEYRSIDGQWLPMVDAASTITGPFEHAWLLPPDALHEGFAVRFTTVASTSEPLYIANLTISERCSADFDDSGFVDTDDFTAFVNAFEHGHYSADIDFSGFVDTDDFTRFVNSFEIGC
ncbi:MAG TPA: S8 family serine peptidase, partial [Phycisphaerales bacterium]|nr:S8 family serine peptidase [Phycisphaerales bacterium]